MSTNTKQKIEELTNKLEQLKKQPRSLEYKKMMKKHHNNFKSICKEAGPWDWCWGLDALIEHLRWMRDYYKLGENVWSTEDKEWKKGVKYTRLETLEKTLHYYDLWSSDLQKEYIKVIRTGEFKSHDNGDGTFTIDNLGFKCVYKYGPRNNHLKAMKITYKKLHKKEQKYKKLFYKMLYKYMESWWD